jgi:toxin FitB
LSGFLKPDLRVLAWMDAADERTLYLSALTVGEIRKGIVTLVEGKRRAQLESWLEIDLRDVAGRILPVDDAVADRWGLLAGEMRRKGKPMPTVDAMIAATALHHNPTVVSRNVNDFKNAEVPVLTRGNPLRPLARISESLQPPLAEQSARPRNIRSLQWCISMSGPGRLLGYRAREAESVNCRSASRRDQ